MTKPADAALTLLEARLETQARHSTSPGISRDRRPTPVIVTLTTVAERLETLHLCVESLLSQHVPPDEIILWLPESLVDVFAAVAGGTPLAVQRTRGLTVRAVRDVGPHTKLVPALQKRPEAVLVTADDDTLYPPDWLATLLAAYGQAPHVIHCHRAHAMTLSDAGDIAPYDSWISCSPGQIGPSHLLFPTGHGGVLYPPHSLDPAVGDERAFRRLCPTADDIWFKAMALLAGTPARKVAPVCDGFPLIRGTERRMLWTVNRATNDAQLQAVFAHYGLHGRLAGMR